MPGKKMTPAAKAEAAAKILELSVVCGDATIVEHELGAWGVVTDKPGSLGQQNSGGGSASTGAVGEATMAPSVPAYAYTLNHQELVQRGDVNLANLLAGAPFRLVDILCDASLALPAEFEGAESLDMRMLTEEMEKAKAAYKALSGQLVEPINKAKEMLCDIADVERIMKGGMTAQKLDIVCRLMGTFIESLKHEQKNIDDAQANLAALQEICFKAQRNEIKVSNAETGMKSLGDHLAEERTVVLTAIIRQSRDPSFWSKHDLDDENITSPLFQLLLQEADDITAGTTTFQRFFQARTIDGKHALRPDLMMPYIAPVLNEIQGLAGKDKQSLLTSTNDNGFNVLATMAEQGFNWGAMQMIKQAFGKDMFKAAMEAMTTENKTPFTLACSHNNQNFIEGMLDDSDLDEAFWTAQLMLGQEDANSQNLIHCLLAEGIEHDAGEERVAMLGKLLEKFSDPSHKDVLEQCLVRPFTRGKQKLTALQLMMDRVEPALKALGQVSKSNSEESTKQTTQLATLTSSLSDNENSFRAMSTQSEEMKGKWETYQSSEQPLSDAKVVLATLHKEKGILEVYQQELADTLVSRQAENKALADSADSLKPTVKARLAELKLSSDAAQAQLTEWEAVIEQLSGVGYSSVQECTDAQAQSLAQKELLEGKRAELEQAIARADENIESLQPLRALFESYKSSKAAYRAAFDRFSSSIAQQTAINDEIASIQAQLASLEKELEAQEAVAAATAEAAEKQKADAAEMQAQKVPAKENLEGYAAIKASFEGNLATLKQLDLAQKELSGQIAETAGLLEATQQEIQTVEEASEALEAKIAEKKAKDVSADDGASGEQESPAATVKEQLEESLAQSTAQQESPVAAGSEATVKEQLDELQEMLAQYTDSLSALKAQEESHQTLIAETKSKYAVMLEQVKELLRKIPSEVQVECSVSISDLDTQDDIELSAVLVALDAVAEKMAKKEEEYKAQLSEKVEKMAALEADLESSHAVRLTSLLTAQAQEDECTTQFYVAMSASDVTFEGDFSEDGCGDRIEACMQGSSEELATLRKNLDTVNTSLDKLEEGLRLHEGQKEKVGQIAAEKAKLIKAICEEDGAAGTLQVDSELLGETELTEIVDQKKVYLLLVDEYTQNYNHGDISDTKSLDTVISRALKAKKACYEALKDGIESSLSVIVEKEAVLASDVKLLEAAQANKGKELAELESRIQTAREAIIDLQESYLAALIELADEETKQKITGNAQDWEHGKDASIALADGYHTLLTILDNALASLQSVNGVMTDNIGKITHTILPRLESDIGTNQTTVNTAIAAPFAVMMECVADGARFDMDPALQADLLLRVLQSSPKGMIDALVQSDAFIAGMALANPDLIAALDSNPWLDEDDTQNNTLAGIIAERTTAWRILQNDIKPAISPSKFSLSRKMFVAIPASTLTAQDKASFMAMYITRGLPFSLIKNLDSLKAIFATEAKEARSTLFDTFITLLREQRPSNSQSHPLLWPLALADQFVANVKAPAKLVQIMLGHQDLPKVERTQAISLVSRLFEMQNKDVWDVLYSEQNLLMAVQWVIDAEMEEVLSSTLSSTSPAALSILNHAVSLHSALMRVREHMTPTTGANGKPSFRPMPLSEQFFVDQMLLWLDAEDALWAACGDELSKILAQDADLHALLCGVLEAAVPLRDVYIPASKVVVNALYDVRAVREKFDNCAAQLKVVYEVLNSAAQAMSDPQLVPPVVAAWESVRNQGLDSVYTSLHMIEQPFAYAKVPNLSICQLRDIGYEGEAVLAHVLNITPAQVADIIDLERLAAMKGRDGKSLYTLTELCKTKDPYLAADNYPMLHTDEAQYQALLKHMEDARAGNIWKEMEKAGYVFDSVEGVFDPIDRSLANGTPNTLMFYALEQEILTYFGQSTVNSRLPRFGINESEDFGGALREAIALANAVAVHKQACFTQIVNFASSLECEELASLAINLLDAEVSWHARREALATFIRNGVSDPGDDIMQHFVQLLECLSENLIADDCAFVGLSMGQEQAQQQEEISEFIAETFANIDSFVQQKATDKLVLQDGLQQQFEGVREKIAEMLATLRTSPAAPTLIDADVLSSLVGVSGSGALDTFAAGTTSAGEAILVLNDSLTALQSAIDAALPKPKRNSMYFLKSSAQVTNNPKLKAMQELHTVLDAAVKALGVLDKPSQDWQGTLAKKVGEFDAASTALQAIFDTPEAEKDNAVAIQGALAASSGGGAAAVKATPTHTPRGDGVQLAVEQKPVSTERPSFFARLGLFGGSKTPAPQSAHRQNPMYNGGGSAAGEVPAAAQTAEASSGPVTLQPVLAPGESKEGTGAVAKQPGGMLGLGNM